MSKKGLHNKNSMKINSNDDNNIINNNHNKKIVSIDVNIIYFTHSRIRPIFTGCNKLISDTLHEILNGKISIKNIPLITIIENNGNYFSLNNRRLYLFKMLAEMNLLDNNDNTVLHNNTDVMSSNQNMIQAYYKKASHKEKLKYIVNNYTLHAKLMSSSHYSINNSHSHDDDGGGVNDGDSHDCNDANNNKSNDGDKTLSGTINIDPRGQSEENIIGDDIDHTVVDVDIIISTSLLTTINNLTITSNSGNYDTSRTVISTTTTSTDDDIDKDDDNISNSNANFTTTTTTSSFSISKSKYEKNKKLYNNNDNNSNINNNNSRSNDYRSNNAVGDQKGKETIKYNNVFVIGNSKIVSYNDDNRIMRNILSIPIIKKDIKNIDKLILKGKVNVVRSILDDWIVNNIINDEQYCYLCRHYNIL
jgi:hypothetical protein